MNIRSVWLTVWLKVTALAFAAVLSQSNPAAAVSCKTTGVYSANGNGQSVKIFFSFAEDCRDVVNIMWATPGGAWQQIEFKPYNEDYGTCIPYNRNCTANMTQRIGANPNESYLFKVQSCRTRVLASSVCSNWSRTNQYVPWHRLQLKHGGQYLDAEFCSNKIGLNPGSDYEGGACQLWWLVPVGGGWHRLQLKHGGQYLDAEFCSNKIGLNPGSDYEGGACQLWRLVPVGGGWSRLQLKHGNQYLDAEFCSNKIGLNAGSDFEGGACQLWRLVLSPDGIN
jgi:Ricin-type beta-trefoil lectin domain-like